MTWNPWKLRRMVGIGQAEMSRLESLARANNDLARMRVKEANDWRTAYLDAADKCDELASQHAALTAEIARLKSPPRGDRGRFVGRG